jgi:hypothetical protein
LGADFNRRSFDSIPAIVTSLGLFMTFVAILVGLMPVGVTGSKVHGLEGLIGGLSGKFVTSIAALLSASVFAMFEKSVFHALARARADIVGAIDALVPVKTQAFLLEEINRTMSRLIETPLGIAAGEPEPERPLEHRPTLGVIVDLPLENDSVQSSWEPDNG